MRSHSSEGPSVRPMPPLFHESLAAPARVTLETQQQVAACSPARRRDDDESVCEACAVLPQPLLLPDPAQPPLKGRTDRSHAHTQGHPGSHASPRFSATQNINSAAAWFASPQSQVLMPASPSSLEPCQGRAAPALAHRPDSGTHHQTGYSPLWTSPTLLATSSAWTQPVVSPIESSVFYPLGQSVQPPLLLHYVQLGHWRTVAPGRDFFNHRRLASREVVGHTVRWLHNAKPRDRFVFIIEPVEEIPAEEQEQDDDECGKDYKSTSQASQQEQQQQQRRRKTVWQRLQRALFGPAPAFAYNRGKLAKESAWFPQQPSETADRDKGEDVREQAHSGREETHAPHANLLKRERMADAAQGGISRTQPSVSPLMTPVLAHQYLAGSPVATRNHSFAGLAVASSPSTRSSPARGATRSDEGGGAAAARGRHYTASPSVEKLTQTVSTLSWRRDSVLNSETGAESLASPTAATCHPQARRNKAIRRMLVAQLFGREGPARYQLEHPLRPFDASQPQPGTSQTEITSAGASSRASSTTSMREGVRAVTGVHSRSASSCRSDTHGGGEAGQGGLGRRRRRSSSASVDIVAASLFDPFPAEPTWCRGHEAGSERGSVPLSATSPPPAAPPPPPAAAAKQQQPQHEERPAPPAGPRRGVEVIEVAHVDITALDYAPRLLSSRFSIEAKAAYTYFFPSTAAACCHYGCPEAVEHIQAQFRAGVSAHIPKTKADTVRSVRQANGNPGEAWAGHATSRENVATSAAATMHSAALSHHARSASGAPLLHAGVATPCAKLSQKALPNGEGRVEAARQPDADEDDEADHDELWSIAAALKKGVLTQPSTSGFSVEGRRRGSRSASAHNRVEAAAATRSHSPWSMASDEAAQALRARSRTAGPAMGANPTLSVSTSSTRESCSRGRPPSLFVTFPQLGCEAAAARPHTPNRLTVAEEGGRSPSVAPPPGLVSAPEPSSPPNPHRSCTTVFDALKERGVERKEKTAQDLVSGAMRVEDVVAETEAATVASMHRSMNSPLFSALPAATTAAPAAAAPASGATARMVDGWRTLDVDAAPLPCVAPADLPRPVLMSAHFDLVLSVYTADPNFNAALRDVLMPEAGTHPYTLNASEQQRLLSMYEAGIPAWAVFVGSMSLIQYRRAYRVLYIGLVNLWPLVSLAVGIYDLYRYLPQMKRFLSHTIEPLVRRIEAHFTLRVSVWATYLFSVLFTIFSNLSIFLSQFYVVQVISPVVSIVMTAVKLPLVLLLESIWASLSITASFLGLVTMTVKLVVLGPFIFVLHVTSWFGATSGTASSVIGGTSLTLRWWRAWQEFWLTVASPIKNLAKAWWDSMLHVILSIARREASLRRWYTSRMTQFVAHAAVWAEKGLFVAEVTRDVVRVNAAMWVGDGWWLSASTAPAMGQLIGLVCLLLTFAHLLVALASERRARWHAQQRARAHLLMQAAASTASSSWQLGATMCEAVRAPPPPLPLPIGLEQLWYAAVHLVETCFVACVRHAPVPWQQALCAAHNPWVSPYLRHAASPPCVVWESEVGPLPSAAAEMCDEQMWSVLDRDGKSDDRSAVPSSIAHLPDGAWRSGDCPVYTYTSREVVEAVAAIQERHHFRLPGTTQVVYTWRFSAQTR